MAVVKASIVSPQRVGVNFGKFKGYPVGGSIVSFEQTRQTGEIIGVITIDGVARNIYGIRETATTAADGLMSAADKAALDNVPTTYLPRANVVNNLTTTEEGYALDARQGKSLKDSVDELNGKIHIKTYSSVTQLGLTQGSATLVGAYNALGANAILLCDAGEFDSSQVPSLYGCVLIYKVNGPRGFVQFFSKASDGDDYRMYLNANNVPNGSWIITSRPTSVSDAGNGTPITFMYSGSGISTTNWLAAWNGYEINAINPANLRKLIGVDMVTAYNQTVTFNMLDGSGVVFAMRFPNLIDGYMFEYWNNTIYKFINAGSGTLTVTKNSSSDTVTITVPTTFGAVRLIGIGGYFS